MALQVTYNLWTYPRDEDLKMCEVACRVVCIWNHCLKRNNKLENSHALNQNLNTSKTALNTFNKILNCKF